MNTTMLSETANTTGATYRKFQSARGVYLIPNSRPTAMTRPEIRPANAPEAVVRLQNRPHKNTATTGGHIYERSRWKYFTMESNFSICGDHRAAMMMITRPAMLPAITCCRLLMPGRTLLRMSMVSNVWAEVKVEVNTEVMAAMNPMSTKPFKP